MNSKVGLCSPPELRLWAEKNDKYNFGKVNSYINDLISHKWNGFLDGEMSCLQVNIFEPYLLAICFIFRRSHLQYIPLRLLQCQSIAF